MKALLLKKKDGKNKDETRKGMMILGGILLVLGVIGLLVFGFLLYKSYTEAGSNSVAAIADGVGLILSAVMLAGGVWAK